jgi:hypothetical protein
MEYIGLTKEAEDYLHNAGVIFTGVYEVVLPDGQLAHLRNFRSGEYRIPITCSISGGITEVMQEYVGGRLYTCLVADRGWGGGGGVMFYALGTVWPTTEVRQRYDEERRMWVLSHPVSTDQAMFKWKRGEPGGDTWLNSGKGVIPDSWFEIQTQVSEGQTNA